MATLIRSQRLRNYVNNSRHSLRDSDITAIKTWSWQCRKKKQPSDWFAHDPVTRTRNQQPNATSATHSCSKFNMTSERENYVNNSRRDLSNLDLHSKTRSWPQALGHELTDPRYDFKDSVINSETRTWPQQLQTWTLQLRLDLSILAVNLATQLRPQGLGRDLVNLDDWPQQLRDNYNITMTWMQSL